MSDKLLLLTYFGYGVVVLYKGFTNSKDVKDAKISTWYLVPVWIMLIIQMWMNMWHGVG